jgi:hypothetical protein
MEKINQFSLQRLLLLMQRYITFNSKTWLIGIGAISGVLIIISLLQAYFSQGHFDIRSLVNTGQVMIFIGGFVITSMAYNEIHTPARSQFYLTLPATTAEKLFSTWLITSVIFILVANILLALVLGLANGVANLAWSSPINLFNPFTIDNLKLMGIYVVTQSIFFLGALQFRKNNFLKTILSIFVIAMVLNIITILFAYLLFGTDGLHLDAQTMSPNLSNIFENIFPKVMKTIFNVVLGPFFLLVSYFKLKEREV